MKTAIIEKSKESLASILPITFIVIILSFFFGPIGLWQYLGFLIGAVADKSLLKSRLESIDILDDICGDKGQKETKIFFRETI